MLIIKIIIRYRKSIWFFPSIFIACSLVFAIVITGLDEVFRQQLIDSFPSFLVTSSSLSRSILTVIATSLLTMTAITFSTIMIVFSVYSSQFSHRTLHNFISARLTQIVLGVFISGFTYSVVALLFIRNHDTPAVSLTAILAILLSLVCIGFFVRFVQFIINSIQVDNLIENINQEIMSSIREKDDEIEDMREEGKVLTGFSDEMIEGKEEDHIRIYSYKTGYIQFFDLKALLSFARDNDILIECKSRIGDYITETKVLFTLRKTGGQKTGDDFKKKIKKFVSIGNYRNIAQDLDYSIHKLEEIALRSLSPAINDPNTAETCILNLGHALSEAYGSYRGRILFHDEEGNQRLLLDDHDFRQILFSSFRKILHFSREQVSVLDAILEAVLTIARIDKRDLKLILSEFLKYALDNFNKKLLQGYDREILRKKIDEISEYTGLPKDLKSGHLDA